MAKKTPTYCFTTTSNGGLRNVLINDAEVAPAHDTNNPPSNIEEHQFKALWDTGATRTVITREVAEKCALKQIGIAKVSTASEHGIEVPEYLINITLGNKVTIAHLRVAEGKLQGNIEILIGMDIINMGDFAVTNKEGQTVFSFRIPSAEWIDFVNQQPRNTPFPRPPQTPIRHKIEPKIGRNAPCPCGSGKKYKNCCLQK